jgi:Tat protein secretion system quality control protein TatD with DNase activity
VAEVAAQLARVKGIAVDEVARVTSHNFEQLFRVADQPHAPQA